MTLLHPGSAVLITNKSRTKFVLQQKRPNHIIPRYRNARSFFGGSMEPGETSEEALLRELEEEILNTEFVREIGRNMRFWKQYRLRGVIYDWYDVFIYEAILDDAMFDQLVGIIQNPDLVTEGKAIVVSRSDLIDLLKSPDLFVGSLDIVIRDWLHI